MTRFALLAGFPVVVTLAAFLYVQLPDVGASAVLHPSRRLVTTAVPTACVERTFQGAGVDLTGWQCHAPEPARGTVVYLHGVADNRASGVGTIARFLRRGFEVVTYDSRAHGGSGGEACTYGFFEKDDLKLVIDTVRRLPVVLIGTSLGAAVALQHAARDARVQAVVAAETFSDLRTILHERAPFVLPRALVDEALARAEQAATFRVDDVRAVRAAERIIVPVLLVHGDADRETPPAHSQRVYDALRGPKRLILVPGATHNGSLTGEMWSEIERWLDDLFPASDARVPETQ